MAWKPDGYTSVAPYLVVDGAQRTIDFLTVVFDAQPLRMHPMGGRLGAHAAVPQGQPVRQPARIRGNQILLLARQGGQTAVNGLQPLCKRDFGAGWIRHRVASFPEHP